MVINRQITARILEDLTFFPVVGIIGPRQVGKTTLAKNIAQKLAKPTLYLDLELETDARKLDDAETFLKLHVDKCVIIDEVQRKPSLFALLRALIDQQREPARFILLGSASPDLIKNTSESLAGRISYLELAPFSLSEISVVNSMQNHWLKGGFPPAFLAQKNTFTFRWLGNFISTFIQRDLRELGYEFSSPMMQKLLEMLMFLNGNLLNISNLARSLGLSQTPILRYLDLLEGSFMVHRLPPYFTNIGKRLIKSPKIYVRDSGILHQLAKVKNYEELLGNPLVGASWEGYVIEQIRRNVDASWQFYFYRTHQGAEIDLLLITPQNKKIAIEIKLSNAPTVSKGFYVCLEDLKPEYKFIIVPNSEKYSKNEDVWVCSLIDFLEKELPKFDT